MFKRTVKISQLRIMIGEPPEIILPFAVTTTGGYVIESAVKKMFEIFGKPASEIIGLPILRLLPEVFIPEVESALSKTVVQTKRTVLCDIRIPTADNDNEDGFITYRLFAEPMVGNREAAEKILISGMDITSQENAERRLHESEMRQLTAIEAAEIGTYEWDIKRTIYRFSERFVGMFGLSGAVEPSNLVEHIHHDDLAVRAKANEAAFQTGILGYQMRTVWPDGGIHWIRMTGRISFDQDGKPSKLYGAAIDITKEKEREEELENIVLQRTIKLRKSLEELARNEEKYYKMVDEVEDYAIMLLDNNGIIQNWNKGAEKIKGYTWEEAVGKSFKIFYLPVDLANKLPERLIEEAAQNGRANHEGWRMRKEGSIFWGSVVLTALRASDGKLFGFSKVTRDLSERKQVEDKLREYTQKLEQISLNISEQNGVLEKKVEDRAAKLQQALDHLIETEEELAESLKKEKQVSEIKSRFVTMASHEFRTPLTTILSSSALIAKYIQLSNDKKSGKHVINIQNAVYHLNTILDDFLDLGNIDQNRIVLRPLEFNIKEWITQVISELKITAKKGQQLNITFNGPDSFINDKRLVKSIIINLISNAIKFSSEGDPTEIVVANSGHELTLTISDRGIGIPKEDIPLLFTTFFRAKNALNIPGTGLGLHLVKRYLDFLGGTITLTSEINKGTSFVVKTPSLSNYISDYEVFLNEDGRSI